MSILAMLAATATGTPIEPDPWTPPDPYPVTVSGVPTAAPWHMADPVEIQGYTHPEDGYSTDQTLHPTVVDFGGKWNGYRFWMIHTPYPLAGTHPDGKVGENFEDPCLSASNDCITWDPIIHPMSVSTHFHSDPEMVWNPDDARLEFWIRDGAHGHAYRHAHSSDGQVWSPLVTQVPVVDIPEQSASIIRLPNGQWRMWTRVGGDLALRTATSPEGPWSSRQICGVVGGTAPTDVGMWHPGIVHAGGQTLLGMHHRNAPVSEDGLYLFRSDDLGQSWAWSTTRTIGGDPASTWARDNMYRPCMVLHENGTHVRVWYSSSSSAHGWRMGYTELPLTAWDNLA